MANKTPKSGLTGSFNSNAEQPSQEEINAFNDAARAGKEAAVTAFLDKYPQAIDAKADNGWTALMLAAANGEKKIARLLLERGADPTVATKDGRPALKFAEREGQREIAAMIKQALREWRKKVLAEKTKKSIPKEINDFNDAARVGDEAKVLQLLQDYPYVLDARADNGMTALMAAAANGEKKMVKLLLSNGANPGAKTAFGRTALRYAEREGQREISAMIKEASREWAEEAKTARKGKSPDHRS